jgi:glycosyltransferase involved in cell wall biosynthesis
MDKKNILYVISQVDASSTIALEILGIRKDSYNSICCFLSNEETTLEQFLKDAGVTCVRIPYSGKLSSLMVFIKLCRLIQKHKPEIVHSHLLWAGMFGLSAARLCGVPQRIITRHYADMHFKYYPKGVWYDWACNKLATKIVAISTNIRNTLINLENVSPEKIKVIEYGFSCYPYSKIEDKRIQLISKKYNPDRQTPVIGVISRFVSWKGVQYIIPAFQRVLDSHPDSLLVMASAEGDFEDQLHKLLKKIPEKNYICIKFEKDIIALYKMFDVFIHVPVSSSLEGFGQVYLESILCGIPSVFTLSGIANDFIEHGQNAYVVDYENTEEIYDGIIACLNGFIDKEKIRSSQTYIRNHFDQENTIKKLLDLYTESA